MTLLLHHLTKALKNYVISQITKKNKNKNKDKDNKKNSHHVYWYHKKQQDYVELLLLFF